MDDRFILVIDEGTTSTRAVAFATDGTVLASRQVAIAQHYPRSGWVEHDAAEIWRSTLACARGVIEDAGGADRCAAIGITNQRETVVAWDRASLEPLCRAIVWQDRRTADLCAQLQADGHEEMVQARTGLLLDPYFSASKMHWLLTHDDAVRDAAGNGRLAFGTVDSWLVARLSGGAAHVTDASNASRTMLYDIEGGTWDTELLDLFGVAADSLPRVIDSCGALAVSDAGLLGAAIPICGIAGDQQAAMIGQGCLAPGTTKATYGTGAFVLTHTGDAPTRSDHRLLATVLCQQDGKRSYALEGSVFVAGSLVQYLRDTLGLIASAEETEVLARSVPDNGGVTIVPALSGLGAPHWRPDARGAITGLGFDTGKAHIARAALEAMAMQTRDLRAAFAADGADWTELRIDGGMSANGWMAQDIADMLDLPVTRPDFVETTALGAAMLAAVGAGMHGSLEDAAAAMIGAGSRFAPAMQAEVRQERIMLWEQALAAI